jgi:hypothetical protein
VWTELVCVGLLLATAVATRIETMKGLRLNYSYVELPGEDHGSIVAKGMPSTREEVKPPRGGQASARARL